MRYVGLVLAGLLVGALGYYLATRGADREPPLRVAPADVASPRAADGAGDGRNVARGARAARTDAPRASASTSGTDGVEVSATGRDATRPAATTRATRAVAPVPLPSGLVVPVQGIAPASLTPTFDDDRGEGRVHEALDIMAPTGTPVLAVADGHVEKLFDSDRGGLTIYQFEPSGRHAYYYAHLDRYAPGLAEGQALRQGEVIGYVGSTGNADPAAPHLHFAIFLLGPEKRWWEGTPIDPWPLLSGRTR
ncbi:M23 family metallopeptidase [Luteimonas sp. MC1750]|uniref:M23 family metallopeptidase n=1 Tax=Luteimonas sp. MC1750 TaxID=2799326 RepID=UPI0018F0CD11|nr:M23 family metallopeptidase [Luteimonas sp. MC1750]MBJ6983293.1 M23 family metallopeptidase [Luteimonas sp. MC1750]QQO06157.1 M23 family metallopeptidase [Luteimonas sp. MC1750]